MRFHCFASVSPIIVVGAALVLGLTATAMPRTASAVSAADEQYAAATRLKPNLDRGAQLFELCSSCHGRDGDGTNDGSVPAIAGQSVPVLVR
jgi:cytochrome c553